jgi:hypothetical protein
MTVRMTPALVEDVAWLAETGESLSGAAVRLGYTDARALERALYRAGRTDLFHTLRRREERTGSDRHASASARAQRRRAALHLVPSVPTHVNDLDQLKEQLVELAGPLPPSRVTALLGAADYDALVKAAWSCFLAAVNGRGTGSDDMRDRRREQAARALIAAARR